MPDGPRPVPSAWMMVPVPDLLTPLNGTILHSGR
ncbi:TPA: hypothetical protein MAK25_003224 [Klebsiella quasipneumoniae subsp. quasipneumoniae]|nr:hypothetical protein [Klebsiella quasipneumoniae subsp. quasipneumoniae]